LPDQLTNEQLRKQQRNQETKQRLLEQEEWRQLMATEYGRNIVRRLLAFSGVKQQCFNGQSNQTIFNDGKRCVGIYLESEVLQAAPGSYVTMIEESVNG